MLRFRKLIAEDEALLCYHYNEKKTKNHLEGRQD